MPRLELPKRWQPTVVVAMTTALVLTTSVAVAAQHLSAEARSAANRPVVGVNTSEQRRVPARVHRPLQLSRQVAPARTAAPAPKPTASLPAPPSAAPVLRPRLPATAGVLLIGDSLAEGTAPYLQGLLPGRQVTQDYGVGRSLLSGVSQLRAEASSLPPILVLSLGTNDVPTPSSFGALVNEALSSAGNRCVIWPDIVRPPSGGYDWDNANAVLAAAASTHPSLHVVPWSTMVRSHPEWLAGDGVHVNTAGYSARAQAIADAVASC